MPKNFLQHETVFMAERFSPVLYKTTTGEEVANYLQSLPANTVLAASFEGVEVVGASFLRTAFNGIRHHAVNGRLRTPMVAFTDLEPEVNLELQMVLESPCTNMPALVVANGHGIKLQTHRERISTAFEAARQLTAENEVFTVADVAETIGAGTPDVNTRLNLLRQGGAVTMWGKSQNGRVRYTYRSLTDADLEKCAKNGSTD
ncbi:MAG TPA: hypothetical protein VG964_01675 [Candidatus Saccharimonadales bacterium]|nr:hypothetical protein [Candidatus Saccharimonadales bacterium]